MGAGRATWDQGSGTAGGRCRLISSTAQRPFLPHVFPGSPVHGHPRAGIHTWACWNQTRALNPLSTSGRQAQDAEVPGTPRTSRLQGLFPQGEGQGWGSGTAYFHTSFYGQHVAEHIVGTRWLLLQNERAQLTPRPRPYLQWAFSSLPGLGCCCPPKSNTPPLQQGHPRHGLALGPLLRAVCTP